VGKFVYLIQALGTNHYKIGVSKHPTKRLAEEQTSNSLKLKLVRTFMSEHPFLLEKALHRVFSHVKREGEWYNLSIDDEVNFIVKCNKIEQSIMILKKIGNVFI